MNLEMNKSLISFYSSESQRIRIMSELWTFENMFCPCCGVPHISKVNNNAAVADFVCNNCGSIFELKTKQGRIGNKINDGSYDTMIERICSHTNPDLFVMRYSTNYCITDLTIIPKFFFVPKIIEKRKPLAPTAKRAGWIGCNILYSNIPKQGKIDIIKNSSVKPVGEIVEKYSIIKKLQTMDLESRSWLLDILSCVNNIPTNEFTLKDIYKYVDVLQQIHINNNNVEAKIRQQLQFLRDKGFIEFLERGHYKKII